MNQARNSKFVESFDDDTSVSSLSSEPLSPSTPTPKPTSQTTLSPEPIVSLFSTLSLEQTTSRCSGPQCKDLRCTTSHAQDEEPPEATIETAFQNLFARLKDHQEHISVEKPNKDASQRELNTVIESSSVETSNTASNNIQEEQYGEAKSEHSKDLDDSLEFFSRDNKRNLEVKFERLVQDLEHFNVQRFEIYRKFQVCLAYHEQMNESPKTCLKCLQHLQDIEKNYREARSRVSSPGLALSPFILAPDLDLDAVLERVPDYAEDFVDNYRSERLLVLERLRLLHRMQKSLLEDFGKAKSWQDLWNDTSATEQPQGYGREQENGKGHEESKDYSEQSEAKEESANVPTAKVYQDARIEDAESHKAHEKSRKSRPKKKREKKTITSV
ncbi:hypothetical protein D6C92_05887 [Aureobasidium pullulans]|uniref:Uncharacterized protein n=1 Tax=Aureobasidium pullulans TaxID=5580 RepID=A0A4S8S9Z2_AURPU|nr:hypothetical protein D6D28_07696 [Aureobasidium pullulans]THY92317.1 hypothetical protein D6C92_05887 [Aureobasidium pullulans]